MLFFISILMHLTTRLKESLRPALIHLACGAVVAAAVAALLFFFWYPWPYDEFSGGRNLFLLVMGVDLVCGPLLTLLLYTRTKPIGLLTVDLVLILFVQASALYYGLHVAYLARPVYLVAEYDRLKAIAYGDLPAQEIQNLPPELRTGFWKKPLIVGIRPPASVEEKNKVMFDAARGGRDYGDRPEFYIPYGSASAQISLSRGRRLKDFLAAYPSLQSWANEYALRKSTSIENIKYLPVIAREDWIAVLDDNGYVSGFVKGDGF